MRSRRKLAASLVALALLAGACGSTARTTKPRGRPQADPAAPSGEPAAAAPAPSTAPGSRPSGGPASLRSPRSGSRTVDGGSAPLRGGVQVSQGVTDKEIFIGFTVSSNFDAAARAYGLNTDQDSAADRKKIQAVVDWLNARGGIAGRRVVPVVYDVNSLGNFDVEAQAACARWTEDAKVFAALAWLYDRETLASCLQKRNVLLLKSAYQVYDKVTAERYAPFFWQPDFLFGDRWRIYIDGLADQGFFEPQSRIGLVRLDEPEHQRTADNVLKPALAARGLRLAEEVAVYRFQDAGGAASQTNSALANAVLRFRQSGVDRVLFIDMGFVLAWLFITHAESQQYRPRYGLTSLDVPGGYLQSNVPAAQLRGSLGVGWWPIADENRPSGGQPAEVQCVEIMRSQGLNVDFNALAYCSRLFFLKAAVERARDITPAGVRAAADTLGASWSSALTWQPKLVPGRYDGVAAVRPFAYNESCGCFRYTGDLVPVPP